jgi:Uma2 family endonuclease
MGNTVRLDEIHLMTVDEFLATPQNAFGSAWRYELVDGLPVAQAAPSDEHAMISANLAAALTNRLRGNRDCVPLVGAAVIPKTSSAELPASPTRRSGAGASRSRCSRSCRRPTASPPS